MNIHASILTTLLLLGSASTLAAEPTTGPSAGLSTGRSSGLDLPSFDPGVRTQDDLFLAVNGGWLARTEIPEDKSTYGTFLELRDLSDERVRRIIEELVTQAGQKSALEQKIAAFYAAYTDTAAIDRAGLTPARSLLASIDAIQNRSDLARWIGQAQGHLNMPLLLGVRPDFKDPGINQAVLGQGGLGLPNRDYYLENEARIRKARAAYETYLTKLATLAGETMPAVVASQVMGLEQRIAVAHWDKIENRNPVKTYNPTTLAELAARAPAFDWSAFLGSAQLNGIDGLSVSQPSAVVALATLLTTAPLEQWKAYLKLRALDAHAGVLPQPFREAHFAFHGTALTGAKAERPRWQQGIAEVNAALGQGVGQLYVARHFPPAYKARMAELVANLMGAYKESIDRLSWMSPATKIAAQDKLSKYRTKIAYPDVWRDYTGLVVEPTEPFANQTRSSQFEWQRIAARVGQPVDRTEWSMTPQTVNAYYNSSKNEIVFPAAILQPPFFDMAADDAVNYGAIGAVIGHEISHGFDDRGSQFDGDGVLRNWWTPEDRQAFEAIGARLVAQFETYEPIPGKKLNGKLTLGENIADLSGLQIAYKAYLHALGGKPSPVIAGYTGEQRFFLGWSQAWRKKEREERALQLLTTDPHSPGEFRANGAAVNHDGFHEAFATQPGDRMFKAREQRIRIW